MAEQVQPCCKRVIQDIRNKPDLHFQTAKFNIWRHETTWADKAILMVVLSCYFNVLLILHTWQQIEKGELLGTCSDGRKGT
jgi:hypothetical protein